MRQWFSQLFNLVSVCEEVILTIFTFSVVWQGCCSCHILNKCLGGYNPCKLSFVSVCEEIVLTVYFNYSLVRLLFLPHNIYVFVQQ